MKPKLIIATIKKLDTTKNKYKTVGYRLYDIEKKELEDFSLKSKKFLNYMIRNKDNIENAMYDSIKSTGVPRVKFLNGAEERYPVIDADSGQLLGTNPLVIVAEFRDGYLVVGPFGETFEWTKNEAVAYAKLNGIANGKCLSKGNSEYISAISGGYPYIDRCIVSPNTLVKQQMIKQLKDEKSNSGLKTDKSSKVGTFRKKETPEDIKDNVKKDISGKEIIDIKEKIDKNSYNEVIEPLSDSKSKIISDYKNEKEIPIIIENEKDVISGEDEKDDISPVMGDDSTSKSIYEQGIIEDLSNMPLTKDETNEIEKIVEKQQKFSDDFYKQLEPTFGGKKSVDILKYMIEERNYSIEAVYQLIDEGKDVNKYVPTLIGLLTKYSDSLSGLFDEELDKLCRKAIDPEVLDIELDLANMNIEFNEVWDAPAIINNRVHNTSVWAFPLSLLEERIANYIIFTGKELYGCLIKSDGTYYCGNKVDVPGYEISGVNPRYITITNKDNKTKKVKSNK